MPRHTALLAPLLLPLVLALASSARAQNTPFTWIEAQDTSAINLKTSDKAKVETAGWGNVDFLSNKNWFQISVDEGNVDAAVPAEGVVLSYKFRPAQAGRNQVWDRIGYEFVRSPFDWRIDNGPWKRISPDELTTDLMPIAEWTEVAWLQLGEANLAAGEHTLDIRLPKTKNGDKTARILYASDALVIAPSFRPNGPNKPGQNSRSARDDRASASTFEMPEPRASGERAQVSLKGDWEVARDDEQSPGRVDVPIERLPAANTLNWGAIAVPGDKNQLRPDLLFAHRIWYRTHVQVPTAQAGRSFFLNFPLNNLNTTVYVNGTLCGFNKNPFAPFDVDVSKAIKPGANEICVGIRDAWYGRQSNPDEPMKLRRTWNLPEKFFHEGFQDFAYPVWNCSQSGLLNTPTLVTAGPAYASDVFVKPRVGLKQLQAEVTLSNPAQAAASGEVRWEAVDSAGRVAKAFRPQPFSVAAGQSSVLNLSDGWADAKLWWPDQPTMYRLRTRVVNRAGQVLDESETPFGFREWTTDGTQYKLNNIVWHLWAELTGGATKEEYKANYLKHGQRTMRFVTAGQAGDSSLWFGLETPQALSWMDQNGITVRRNTTLDGETIGYKFSEDDPKLKAKYGTEIKQELMDNWRDQCVAQVRGERNHPSIQIWSLENEFAYINLINLLGNSPNMDRYEAEITKCAQAVQAIDPTRSIMIDGGGATKLQTLPTHGSHYVATLDASYPDKAYEANPLGGGRGRWEWDQKRPRFLGEDFFATGINPADYAMFGGEDAFQGKAQAKPAVGRVYRMLQEGYRWGGYNAAWHFWVGEETASNQYGANAERAALVREYDWTFGSGQNISRTVGLFNDSHYDEPLTFSWNLSVGGKSVQSKSAVYNVAPGTNQKFKVELAMPVVQDRAEGQWTLSLKAGGREVFRDVKDLSVLNPNPNVSPAVSRRADFGVQVLADAQLKPRIKPALRPGARAPEVRSLPAVYDPKGEVSKYLKSINVPFVALNSLENLPQDAQALVVGRDALSVADSTSSALAAFASGGRRVIVLEQGNPLKFQALPAEMESTPGEGRIGFIEDATSPVLSGLRDKDFFTFGPSGVLYRQPYLKPTRGAKSLLQVDERLSKTALVQVPVGSGLMLLSQVEIAQNLGSNVVAQKLLRNLLGYAATYKQQFRSVAALVSDPALQHALDGIGLKYSAASDVLQVLGDAKIQLAIVSGTPANLHALAANKARLNAFNARGGTLVLCGVGPDGLADYNKVVGFEHMMRPSKRERVLFSSPKNPLSAGLSTSDIVLLSGQRMFGWTADEYVAEDMFSNVVDYDEVASFGKSSFGGYNNITNGFFSADGWPLIINVEIPKDAAGNLQPFDLPIELPKPQTIREFAWVGNTFYYPQTEVKLSFEGKNTQTFATAPNTEPQTFEVKPPQQARNLTLTISKWSAKENVKPLVGIDNIYLKAARPPDFYDKVKPFFNVGGMMHYPRGSGGIILCNLAFKDSEPVAVNVLKKRNILSAVLHNLQAPFGGAKTIIAGANLNYAPVDISRQANQFRSERGWFGDKSFSFAALPTGRQQFGGVPFDVYDFPTSPVPTSIMLGGANVPGNLPEQVNGIPVNRKADALFFLQAARIDQRRNSDELKANKKLEMARYVVHYADGSTENVPIYAEIDVDDYKQKAPAALPGAQVGWVAPYAGTEFSAVAYVKTWNNPKPDVAIASVDLQYGADRRGVPALLALTAANAR